jgi:hypothetical protein
VKKAGGLLFLVAALTLPVTDGQAATVESVRFKAVLSSSHEPRIGIQAMGDGLVEFILTRSETGEVQSAIVDFRVQYYFGAQETLFDMHIHRGAQGVTGPVVIPSGFGATVTVGPGSGALFRQREVTDAEGIATVMAAIENPSGYYLNLHSQSAATGIMRGQLEPEDAALVNAVKADTAKIDTVMSMLRQMAQVLGLRLP